MMVWNQDQLLDMQLAAGKIQRSDEVMCEDVYFLQIALDMRQLKLFVPIEMVQQA